MESEIVRLFDSKSHCSSIETLFEAIVIAMEWNNIDLEAPAADQLNPGPDGADQPCNCVKLTAKHVANELLTSWQQDKASRRKETKLYCPIPGCNFKLQWWGERNPLTLRSPKAQVEKRCHSIGVRFINNLKEHGKY